MVCVSSGLVRTRSPWLMLDVQALPSLKVTLALPANGLLSLAASGVHEPARSVEVKDRKYRPAPPSASTIMRYWFVPLRAYTCSASNRFSLVSVMMVVALGKVPGKLSIGIEER